MSTTRDKLSLSSDAASKRNKIPKIPKLKEVELKVRFDMTKESLLHYQHTHVTNTHYLQIKIAVSPDYYREWNEPIGQHLVVNCLRKDFQLPYEYPTNGKYACEDGDELLLDTLEAKAEVLLGNEVGYASNLINFTKKEFLPSIVNNTIEIASTFMDNPTYVRAFPRNLIGKSNDKTCLKWETYVQSHVDSSISKDDLSHLNTDDLSYFVFKPEKLHFIDLDKIPSLACLLGYTFRTKKGTFPGQSIPNPHFTVAIKGDEELLYQNLVQALIEQTSNLLENIRQEPVGFLFKDSVSECIGDFNSIKINVFDYIEKAEKVRKKENNKEHLVFAEKLIEYTNDNRLRLAIDQGYYWKSIYFENLTNRIIKDLCSHLIRTFGEPFNLNGDSYLLSETVDKNKPPLIFYCSSDEEHAVDFALNVDLPICNSPSEFALLVNASIKDFFSNHQWFKKLNITEPNTKIHHEVALNDPHQGFITLGNEICECIWIEDYFSGSLIPRDKQIIIEVTRLKQKLILEEDSIPF
jgi:hypothetical protein